MRPDDKCPTNAKEWTIAARNKNCDSIQQSCSKRTASNNQRYVFQYHCVINVWRNATLEVCALNRTILEHCAEFNEMGAVVQDNYYTDCTRLEPPCPTILQFCRSLQISNLLQYWEKYSSPKE
uniref:Uncharacterized protein n=1 Tax=Magallana gigas TaxID=29159 RepID=A0A8W8JLP3_MAGGI